MKAADIPDDAVVAAVHSAVARHGYATPGDLVEQLNAPRKVVLAKARKLIRRDIIDGCACGCSGLFTVKLGAPPPSR